MKNLKVEESVEAYFEADTEGWRSQILGIVIPQMNDEEVIEFYNELLKRLDSKREKIEKSMNIAINAVNVASEKVNKLKIHNLRAKILLTISALLFCLCISAQNINKINFIGKHSYEIPKLCSEYTPTAHNFVNGEEVMTFRTYDFGQLWYQFNKKGICYKIIIKMSTDKPLLKFDESVNYTAKIVDGNVIYTIQ